MLPDVNPDELESSAARAGEQTPSNAVPTMAGSSTQLTPGLYQVVVERQECQDDSFVRSYLINACQLEPNLKASVCSCHAILPD